MNQIHYLNYAAICLLEELGLTEPDQCLIDAIEERLQKILVEISCNG